MNTPIAQTPLKNQKNLNETTQLPIRWFSYATEDQPLRTLNHQRL